MARRVALTRRTDVYAICRCLASLGRHIVRDGASGGVPDRPPLAVVRERCALALSCREAGRVLVADNERDCRLVPFQFLIPSPVGIVP